MANITHITLGKNAKVMRFMLDENYPGTDERIEAASTPFLYEGRICEVEEASIDFFANHPQIPQIVAYANRRLFDTRIAHNEALKLSREQITSTDQLLRENSRSILRNQRCADISYEFEKQIDEVIDAIPEETIKERVVPQYFNFAPIEINVA